MTIEKHFLELHRLLGDIPKPRSIAEVRLDGKQVQALHDLFNVLSRDSLVWLSDLLPLQIEGDLKISRAEMFGALVLALGAEECREESTEDYVWPTVRSRFPEQVRSHLFPGGQPCVELKQAISSAARRLGLRHALGWEDSHEYANTVKLQFGFTRRGARRRLAYWLVGLGQPVSVQTLLGAGVAGLESASFRRLWLALKNYRGDQIDGQRAREILTGSPWVKDHWIPDLLECAKAHLDRLGSGEADSGDVLAEGFDAVGELFLDWTSREPRLYLQIDEDVVQSVVADWSVPSIRFDIDGKPAFKWLRQGGRWSGERRRPIAWDASVVSLCSADGRYVHEFDLIDVGLGEDVLIFDLGGAGRMLEAREWLDPRREYALVYDGALDLAGIDSTVGAPSRAGRRKVSRLPEGWAGTPRLQIDGLVYWEAQVKERRAPETLDLTISSDNGEPPNVTRLGESRRLRIRGVPEDAVAVELLGLGRAIPVASSGDGWLSNDSVRLDAQLLLGTTQLRVRVRTPTRDRCWKPKTEWNVLGLAALEQDEDGKRSAIWGFVDPEKALNRASGRLIVRVFAPSDWAKPRILEGYRLVASGHRPFALQLTSGWGESLSIEGGATLASSVKDHGKVVRYLPAMPGLGRFHGSVLLTDGVEPSDRHSAVLLTAAGGLLHATPYKTEERNRRWLLRDGAPADAWALAYDGQRLGAGSAERKLAKLIRQKPTVRNFALLRWFKVPVLSTEMKDSFLHAVEERPVEFLRAWTSEEGLPNELRHAEVPEDPVLRAALWNVRVPYQEQATQIWRQIVARAPSPTALGHQDIDVWAAQRLTQLCPPFAIQVLTRIKKGSKLTKRAYRSLLGLADESPLDAGDRQLQELAQRSSRSLGVDESLLHQAVMALTDGKGAREHEQTLRRLAESPEGASYFVAAVLRGIAKGNSQQWISPSLRARTASTS